MFVYELCNTASKNEFNHETFFRRKYEEYEEDLSSGIEFTSSRLRTDVDRDVTISAGDYAPTFQLRMRSHVVPSGMTTKMSAFVRGKPEPKITWYKNGMELSPGGTKYYISNIGGKSLTNIGGKSLTICTLYLNTRTSSGAPRI